MSQNAFQYNEKFYEQTRGTAMGNPLSPFLAEVFMSKFETDTNNSLKDSLKHEIDTWT